MALTTVDIENYLEKYTEFKGVYAIDQLPVALLAKPFGIVINLDPSWKQGSHWTSVYVPAYGSASYFDSYARKPPPLIESFLQRNCKNYGYTFNQEVYQGDTSLKCGYYCIKFLQSCFINEKIPFEKCATMYNENLLKKIFID